MNMNDIGGLGAAVGAGYLIGTDVANGDWSTTDIVFVVALLIIAFYLAVYLS